jgi:hypothetical protein
MPDTHLESLYQQARSALKSRDYDYAIELLKRVLVVDENYKDTSRLLEKAIRLRKLRWYKNPRLWGALGLVVVFVLGFVVAPRIGSLFASPAPTETFIPTATRTAMPTITPSITPTRTLRPTPTATPIPVWVTGFAEPILLAVQDRPPDFQDDFSQVSPGWQFDTDLDNLRKIGIANGALLMSVESRKGSATHSKMRFNNFVLQADIKLQGFNYQKRFNFPQSDFARGSSFYISWRYTQDGNEDVFILNRNSEFLLQTCKDRTCKILDTNEVTVNWDTSIFITVIVNGTECAIYLNDTPVAYANNLESQIGNELRLGIGAIPESTSISFEYDNLKVWDLDKIQNLP